MVAAVRAKPVMSALGPAQSIEPWQHVWRRGIARLMKPEALVALQAALAEDSPRLCQGSLYERAGAGLVIVACDPIAYVGWTTLGLVRPGDLVAYSNSIAAALNVLRLMAPAGHTSPFLSLQDFTRHWDRAPRHEAFRGLLHEVRLSLANLSFAT